MNNNRSSDLMRKVNYFIFFLLLFCGFFTWTTLNQVGIDRNIIIFYFLVMFFSFVTNIFYSKKTWFEWFVFIFIFSVISISVYKSHAYIMMANFLLIMAFKDKINFRTFNDIFILVYLVGVFLTPIIWSLGGLPDFIMFRTGVGYDINSLGFRHINTLPLILNYFFIAVLIKFNKFNFSRLLFVFMIFILFLLVISHFYSRTSLITLIFTFLLFLLCVTCKKKIIFHKITFFILIVILISFLLVTYYLITHLDNSFVKAMDLLLSHRLYFANIEYNKYGINLFGSIIESNSGWLVDNLYAVLLIRYGIINIVIIFGFMILLLKKIFYFKNRWLLLSWVYLVIFSFSESSAFNLTLNYFVFSFCSRNLDENEFNSSPK